MNKKILAILMLLFVLFMPAVNANASSIANLGFVETEVILLPEGDAIVTYTIRYNIIPGKTMLAFTLQGFDRLNPVFDRDNCWVIMDDDNTSYGVNIVNNGDGKYRISNANEQRLGGEYLTYKVRFTADMASAGYLAPTTSEEGRNLTVFNWAPVQWDEAMEHYAVSITYPLEYPQQSATREEVEQFLVDNGFATEKWMNERYSIDYKVETLEGTPRVQVLLYKKAPEAKFKFEIQQYISRDVFNQRSIPDKEIVKEDYSTRQSDSSFDWRNRNNAQEDKKSGRVVLIIALGAMFVAIFAVVGKKHKSLENAHDTLDEIQWARTDWEPPTLEIASFRKDGTIAENLDDIEVALFLGTPYKTILSAILSKLVAQGFIEEISQNPLKVRRTAHNRSSSELGVYERMMYDAADDGEFSGKEIENILKKLVDNVQQKTWDSDIEATKKYYEEKLSKEYKEQNPNSVDEGQVYEEDGYAKLWPHWYFYHSGGMYDSYTDNFDRYDKTDWKDIENVKPRPDFGSKVDKFACHSACHDACHSACHSACHDACHSACHSACHDACHSACVSGGAE